MHGFGRASCVAWQCAQTLLSAPEAVNGSSTCYSCLLDDFSGGFAPLGPYAPPVLALQHALGQLWARRSYAARTRLRISPARFSRARPSAMASITIKANPIRSRIFASPRMKWRSKPKLTSKRLLTRSTAVRFL